MWCGREMLVVDAFIKDKKRESGKAEIKPQSVEASLREKKRQACEAYFQAYRISFTVTVGTEERWMQRKMKYKKQITLLIGCRR